MHPWEKDRNSGPQVNSEPPWTVRAAIKHIGWGLGVAVLIYSSVIYQNIFAKQEDEKRK